MEVIEVELYANISNSPIIKMPTRKFPGVLIQGDSLSILFELAVKLNQALEESRDDSLIELAEELKDLLQNYMHNYDMTLKKYGIKPPYFNTSFYWNKEADEISRREIEDLLQKIESGDPRQRIKALENLEQFANVPALIPLLRENAVEPLIKRLKDEDSDVRFLAILALKPLKNPRAIQPLLDLFTDEDWSVREVAAETVASDFNEEAFPHVIDIFLNNPTDDFKNYYLYHDIFVRNLNPDSVNFLINAINNDNWKIRAHAILILGERQDKNVMQPLIKALNDPIAEVKLCAVWALTRCDIRGESLPTLRQLQIREDQVQTEEVHLLNTNSLKLAAEHAIEEIEKRMQQPING